MNAFVIIDPSTEKYRPTHLATALLLALLLFFLILQPHNHARDVVLCAEDIITVLNEGGMDTESVGILVGDEYPQGIRAGGAWDLLFRPQGREMLLFAASQQGKIAILHGFDNIKRRRGVSYEALESSLVDALSKFFGAPPVILEDTTFSWDVVPGSREPYRVLLHFSRYIKKNWFFLVDHFSFLIYTRENIMVSLTPKFKPE